MNKSVRDLFPITKEAIYLDNAYLSPLATPVAEAGEAFERKRMMGKAGRTDDWAELMDVVKGKFASLLHTSPDQFAITGNTSEGTNIVASMIGLKPTDNVVWDDLDHISNQLIWLRYQKRIGFETRILHHQNWTVPVESYRKLIDERTKVISVSLVAHNNGFRYDVEELAQLAHDHGAFLHVDAIQAVGALNLDLSNSGIDFLTCATYKWLLGPQGLGLFYIRPALLDTFEPIYSGWMQLKNWLSDPKTICDNLHTSARKFQTASFDSHAITQMNAALDLILSVGIEKIEAHNLSLARQLWQGLASIGLSLITPKPIQSAIVTCEISPEIRIEQKLADSGCIATEREGLLRFSPHLYNNEEEINKVLKMVEHIVS